MPTIEVEHASTEAKLISSEELAAMGEIGSYELVEGRIVPMSPTDELHGGYDVLPGFSAPVAIFFED
jgi:hypothetical protein